MSTPSLPNRQQLEEIDALLKRMLALPPLASEAVEPTPTPSPSPYAQPTIREVPPLTPPAPGDPVVQAWRVEFPQAPAPTPTPTPAPTSVASWGTPVAPAPAPLQEVPRFTVFSPPPPVTPAPIAYNPAPYTPPTAPPLYTLPAATPTAPVAEASPMWMWPVLFINGLYDFLTYVVGPGGHFLRTRGRKMLGYVGVLMVLVSAVWLVGNWQGYDWPKIPWQKVDLSRIGLTK